MKSQGSMPVTTARPAAVSPGQIKKPIPKIVSQSARDKGDSELLKSLNSTSQSARKSWLFFLVLMAYLFVAIASVTHADLLLNTPIKLPILQIEVALTGFFLVAPALCILVHFGVLLHHRMLKQKTDAFNSYVGRSESRGTRSNPARALVSSYFYSQREAGPETGVSLRMLLRAMTFLTLHALPLYLLLYFQIAYLPMHDMVTTSLHRSLVICDVAIIAIVTASHFKTDQFSLRAFGHLVTKGARSILGWPIVAFLSFGVATLPSGWGALSDSARSLDRMMTELWPTQIPFEIGGTGCLDADVSPCAFWVTALIFEQPINYVSGRRPFMSRNLVVTDRLRLLPEQTKTNNTDVSFSFRGRDLRFATFDRTNFQRADFTAADLSAASLRGADIREARFGCAIRGKVAVTPRPGDGWIDMTRDDEACAKLVFANLSGAKISDGALRSVALYGINLSDTNLSGYDFKNMDLTHATMARANLSRANFNDATLDGSDLRMVEGVGATFSNAKLTAANLSFARFQGADFSGANLSGALLHSTTLSGAVFRNSVAFGANFGWANVWKAIPSSETAYTLAHVQTVRLEADWGVELPNPASSAQSKPTKSMEPRRQEADWSKGEEAARWRRLSERRPAEEAVGSYLGDIACRSADLFRGVIRTYFEEDSLGVWEARDQKMDLVVPPGVSAIDAEQLSSRGFGDSGSSGGTCCGGRGLDRPYRDIPKLVSAFYRRVSGPKCDGASAIWPGSLAELGRLAENAAEENRPVDGK